MSPPGVSAHIPDWSRELKRPGSWDPGRALLAALRDHQRLCATPRWWTRPWRIWAALRHRCWSVICGADIPLNVQIEGGLLLPHPQGVVIHPAAVIGPNCLIFQQVTLGEGGRPGLPRLEGHVDVGAGAKILGGVTIGAHARIGANAVVLSDVPPGATAVGVPACILVAPRASASAC